MELKLTGRERSALEAVVVRLFDAKQLKRVQGLLAVADGERPTLIARQRKVMRATIYEWVKRWRRNSQQPDERLLDAARPGRPPVVREALGEHLPELMAKRPTEFGDRHAKWIVGLLQVHLAEGLSEIFLSVSWREG